jgi:hypothetical protein
MRSQEGIDGAMNHAILLLLGAVSLPLLACSPSQQERALNAKMDTLEQRLTRVEKDLSDRQRETFDYRFRLDELESGTASVNMEEDTYAVARSAIGTFLMVCKKVEPRLDGYSVRLWIGNTTNLTFYGATLHLKWHPAPSEKDWFKQMKEKDVEITNVLRPGFYTQVDLTVAPSSVTEIRNLTVGIKPNSVSLPLARP